MTAAIDPKRIRERVGLSQAEFAARYRLSRDTVRGWEAGRPLSGSARILLTLIDRAPDQIADILAEEVPNAETVAAMQAARSGEGTDFATLDDLFADLNAPDH
jgi:transcriptional regulator with XRE-family HTH domain